MKGLLDKDFRYVPSYDTNIRDAFDREKKKLEEQKQRSEQVIKEAEAVVAKTRIKGKL